MKTHFFLATLALLTAVAPYAQSQSRRAATTPSSATAPNNSPAAPTEPAGKLDYRNPAADVLIPVEADKLFFF